MNTPQHGQQSESQAVQPGQLFGVPKYSTQRRFVVDNQNQGLSAVPKMGTQTNVQTGRVDQLDIVQGEKLYCQQTGTWTNTGGTLVDSPFGVAACLQNISFKLQAAYNTFNLTGPLASLVQGFRPQWGSRTPSQALATVDAFAAHVQPTSGQQQDYHVDIPFAIKFDEYYDLSAQGDPVRKVVDALVSPQYMAAQAKSVTPTITLAPQITDGDTLGGPVARGAQDTTSTYTGGVFSAQMYRDAYWTANNAASNPPQYPWLYTRDYFTQPTSGQGKACALIQNTGTSCGQVLSLFGFVWDPTYNAGFGGIVPFSAIESFELVTGGSLQNLAMEPQALSDMMFSKYPGLKGVGAWDKGAFLFDFALSPDGAYLTNANAINTYLVNGVQLNITFKPGITMPSTSATVYLGMEALKLATS